MALDLRNICRLCMQDEDSLLPLFEVENGLPAKIEAISACIKVCAGDGLPAQVCQQCVQQVNICYNFKIQCERSDANLREYLHSVKPQEFLAQD
ncbi:uncharacterized protein LOC111872057 isoform X2 [Cryptotermes secundus]|uniref:uncharacterized protein LOC111872057 isoform X2 n=1 Tax=Cryptotermes secundus TaxID=105785 RepID=UPI001454D42D|nr:uncharacterized protein LOC111872057 isoform X2 [Cryptotermes secundus]